MTLRWTLALAVVAACWRGPTPVPVARPKKVTTAATFLTAPCESLRRYLAMIPQDAPIDHCDPTSWEHAYWWCRWDAANDTLSAWKWWAWAATNDLEACAGDAKAARR